MLHLMFMPWYRWNFKTSPTDIIITGDFYSAVVIAEEKVYISKNANHYNTINLTSSYFRYVTTNNNWVTINSSLSSSKFLNYIAATFYSKDEINSEYFIPLGESVLNGTYIMPKDIEFPMLYVYGCKYKINDVYKSPIMLYTRGDQYLCSLDSVMYYSYTGYTSTSYIGVPSFPTSTSNVDYVLTKRYNSPSGVKTATATQTILQEAKQYTDNFNGEFYFENAVVPQYVADFFNNNAILPNTNIIVKYKQNILGSLRSLYEIKSAQFTHSNNKCYLIVTDIFGTSSSLTYDYTPIQGQQLIGLSVDGKTIAIPVNNSEPTEIKLKGDNVILYECYQTYRPPTTTFEIKTYNYSGETSRLDKTDYLTPISTLSGALRGEASLLNFNVLIQSDAVPNFNYCYIDKFKRYYYITEPVSVRQNLWELTMQVDALMTYKDSLLKCEGYIDRNEYIQNKMIIDNNRAIMQGAEFEEDTITNAVFGEGSFVLSGLGLTLSDT